MADEQKSGLGKRIVIISTAFIILVAVIVILIKHSSGELFNITFYNAKNLQPGDSVVYRGINIGEVRRIKLHKDEKVLITVWIKKEFFPYVNTSSSARIVSQGMPNVSGRKYIEWLVADENAELLKPNAIIEGSESLIGYKLKKARLSLKPIKEKLKDVYDAALDEISDIKNSFKELKNDEDLQALAKQIKDYAGNLKQFEKDKKTEYLKKLFSVKDRLFNMEKKWDDAGKTEIARKLRDLADYLEKTGSEDIENEASDTSQRDEDTSAGK